MNTIQTEKAKTQHPIFNTSEFFVPTAMVVDLKDQLLKWLWNGSTGALILGNYRIGKTAAIRHLSKRLTNRCGEPISAVRLTIRRRDQNIIAGVFRNLCFAVDMSISRSATADNMSNNLIHHFGELALKNSTHQIVLFVDEMQRLNLNQLEAFAELYDVLTELGVNLAVFFVGNKVAALPLIDQVMHSHCELIRGRFFTQSFDYYGLRRFDDLRTSLKFLDHKTDSGKAPAITEYFLPKEYAEGWRIESIAPQIWDVYSENYKRRLKLDSWGMQYFISMVKALLVDYLPKYDVSNSELLEDMIIESINISGLVPDLVSVE